MDTKRILDKRIRVLKRIEEQGEAAEQKARDLGKSREKVLKDLWENPVRMTEVTDEVKDLLGKAEKNPFVKLLMGGTRTTLPKLGLPRLSLKEIALAIVGDETYIGQQWDCPAHNSWKDIYQWNNAWRLRLRYLYGGPRDPVRLIFAHSRNNAYYLCGFMVNSPMGPHEKRAA